MATTSLKPALHACCPPEPGKPPAGSPQVALVGNPNAGKTTLFNALTGMRAKTANFPGTTIEIRLGPMREGTNGAAGEAPITLVDLPGLYSLQSAEAEERVALDSLLGRTPGHAGPQAVVLLIDATNLTRNLYLASQTLELGLPTAVALTMVDIAEGRGMKLNLAALAEELDCRVIATTAKTGRGVGDLSKTIRDLISGPGRETIPAPELPRSGEGEEHLRYEWAERIAARCQTSAGIENRALIERFDRFATHPVLGVAGYLAVMVVVFYLIFAVAAAPMDWISSGVNALGNLAARIIPAGDFQNLIVKGVIGGVGGVLVFLPQICLIFFCLTLLEDVGYMARAALVMDRLMRRVGLPGKAFVPMLSAHACAIPAIMSTRIIENKRDRLVTILILPLLTCSARLPVYAMVTALLFPHAPLQSALVFMGAYGLGLVSAIAMAMVFRRTILPGATQPLAIELPDYRRPSLKLALMTTWDRARMFLTKAGTIILAVAILLWWLSSYPNLDPANLPAGERAALTQLQAQASAQVAAGQGEQAAAAEAELRNRRGELRLEHSFAGRLGHWIEPAIRPLGFDWRIGVGVISSFAAREVVVSTLAIIYGLGDNADNGEGNALYQRMREARWPDGRPIFSFAACMSLLVFFVLAMQCVSTLAVIWRETGQWRWVFLQQGYMTVLAYGAALVTYQVLSAIGKA